MPHPSKLDDAYGAAALGAGLALWGLHKGDTMFMALGALVAAVAYALFTKAGGKLSDIHFAAAPKHSSHATEGVKAPCFDGTLDLSAVDMRHNRESIVRAAYDVPQRRSVPRKDDDVNEEVAAEFAARTFTKQEVLAILGANQ